MNSSYLLCLIGDETKFRLFNNITVLLFPFLLHPSFPFSLQRIFPITKPHIPKELPTPPGEFHPVSFKALAEPSIEFPFHTTKVGKRYDICKFNGLCINGLTDVYRSYDEIDEALFGGPGAKFLEALKRPQGADNWLIFNGLKMRLAA